MNPSTHDVARQQASELYRRHFRGGSLATRRRRYRTAGLIAERIWRRWQVGVYRWRRKHARWYLAHCIGTASKNTQYQHFLVLGDLVRMLGQERWLEHLQGPWMRPSGDATPLKSGRPRLH